MKNNDKSSLVSGVTKCYKLVFGRIYKLSNNTKKELEAFVFLAITFIYPSEKNQKPRNFYKS